MKCLKLPNLRFEELKKRKLKHRPSLLFVWWHCRLQLMTIYRGIIRRKSEISNTALLIMELSWKCPISAGWVQPYGSQGRGRRRRCTDIYSNPGVVCGHWTGDKCWTQRSEAGAKFHPLWRSLCWKRQTEKAAEVWSVPAVWEINQSSCINTTQSKGILSRINVRIKLYQYKNNKHIQINTKMNWHVRQQSGNVFLNN